MRHYAKLLRATLTALLMLGAIEGAAVAGPLEDADAASERGDFEAAYRLLRPLAEQGVALAQTNLGFMYANGRGVPQDYSKALEWFRKAADQGFATAQTNLGIMYYMGLGVPQDYAEAMKWLRLAADHGVASAQGRLGAMYGAGYGVPQDDTEAVKWFRRGADQGDNYAQLMLGFMFELGRGVPQDYVQAHMRFNIAAASSKVEKPDAAAENRDRVAAKMTPAQIAEAEKLAHEWKPKPER